MTPTATGAAQPVTNSLSASATLPLFGAITLAVTFGVELMITAFVAWGRLPHAAGKKEFTARAWREMRPERDLKIYIAGIALTLLLMTAGCWGWLRWTRKTAADRPVNLIAGTQVGMAIVGLVAFFFLLSWLSPPGNYVRRPAMDLTGGIELCAVGIAVIVAAVIDYQSQVSSRARRLLVWLGPVLMALSIRIQLLLAPAALELEMVIFLAAIWYWLRARRQHDSASWKLHALRRSAILAAMAAGSFIIYLTLLPATQPAPTESLFQDSLDNRARIPVLAMVICVLLDIHFGSRKPQKHRRLASILCDICVPTLLQLTVFIPPSNWENLMASFLQADELHHWNFFTLGPALAFSHGRALITETYAQYGVAWPFLFGIARHFVKLSYQNVIGWSIIYGCVYIVALYFFLRWLMRDSIWAACGAMLAVTLQLFSGEAEHQTIWNFPSSTMLRHPLDVWFFLVLLANSRFGTRKWLYLAGAIGGAAVLFGLDTGVDLLIILCFYSLMHLVLETSTPRSILAWRPWFDLAIAGAISGAVWLMGMMLASRGTVFHRAFWSEYVEGLRIQAFSGFGLLPIANNSGFDMAVFGGILVIYFFALGLALSRIWLGTGSEIDLFLASVSAYGLGLLLLFVGRSHPFNMYHPMIPLAMVIVMLLYNFRTTIAQDVPWTSFPWVMAVASLALLWTKPQFLDYPSLLQPVLLASPYRRMAGISAEATDIGGVSSTSFEDVHYTSKVAKAIKNLPARDADVAVLDDRDTLLYYLSDRVPWSRYSSLFHCLFTYKMIAQTERELLKTRPRYVVIRSAPSPDRDFSDIWSAFHEFIPRHYRLEKTVAGYEFWRIGQ